jgi:hypothetical protein
MRTRGNHGRLALLMTANHCTPNARNLKSLQANLTGSPTMATALRSKKTTLTNMVKTMAAVSTELASPIDLTERENFYFGITVRSRETDTWSELDLVTAATLAQELALVESIRADLATEGLVIKNDRGTPIANPKSNALTSHVSAMQSLQRMLGLSASQKGMATGSQRQRNHAEAQARKVVKRASTDSLLAGVDDGLLA